MYFQYNHSLDAFRYMIEGYRTQADQHAARIEQWGTDTARATVRMDHPEWPEEMVEAHLALHRPTALKFRRYAVDFGVQDPSMSIQDFLALNERRLLVVRAPTPETPSLFRRWRDRLRSCW